MSTPRSGEPDAGLGPSDGDGKFIVVLLGTRWPRRLFLSHSSLGYPQAPPARASGTNKRRRDSIWLEKGEIDKFEGDRYNCIAVCFERGREEIDKFGMASSSRRCSDDELQKALADIDELVARRPFPDEFKFPGPEEEQENNEKQAKKTDKKKKYILPPEDVEMLLSFECKEFPPMDELNKVAEEEKGDWEDLRVAVSALQVCGKHGICVNQEWRRHQLTKGKNATYEATDDDFLSMKNLVRHDREKNVTDDEAEEEVAEAHSRALKAAEGGGGTDQGSSRLLVEASERLTKSLESARAPR